MPNTWPGGKRKALFQSEHERWNASNYPGTRQLCFECGDETGCCEEDGLWSDDGEPLCHNCYGYDIEIVNHGKVFGEDDWYTFCCGYCRAQVRGTDKKCEKCGVTLRI